MGSAGGAAARAVADGSSAERQAQHRRCARMRSSSDAGEPCCSQTFSLISGDNGARDVRAALERRGWSQAPEGCYDWDFQWSVVADKIEYDVLRPSQIVNHHEGAAKALTTKRGLLRSLNEARWVSLNPDLWFPRCFDLTEKSDVASFQVNPTLTPTPILPHSAFCFFTSRWTSAGAQQRGSCDAS